MTAPWRLLAEPAEVGGHGRAFAQWYSIALVALQACVLAGGCMHDELVQADVLRGPAMVGWQLLACMGGATLAAVPLAGGCLWRECVVARRARVRRRLRGRPA